MPILRHLTISILLWTIPIFAMNAQQKTLDIRISVSVDQITFAEALVEIEAQTNVSFSYSSKQINTEQIVSLHVVNLPLDQALNQFFFPLHIEYELVENKIILKPSDAVNYTVSGYIRDHLDGENIIGATVLVKGLSRGAISNTYGFYSITMPSGIYELQYSYLGYGNKNQNIKLDRNKSQNISLSTMASELDEIVITPEDSSLRIENAHHHTLTIDNTAIIQKTATMGESDVIKSLEVIPGIQLFRDGSTFFNVRGGDRDQNQILLDEAPIYNPAHFLGLFSAIMPEVVKDMKIYKGDLPARMGGRLSSVLDISTRDGNLKEFSSFGSIGMISGRLAIEGPIIKNKSSFFVSGRRSFIQSIVQLSDPTFTSLFFSDFTAKANLLINDKNRIYLSTYSGKDEFITDGGLKWGNKATTLRWNHLYSNRLFSNTTLYTSKYEYALVSPPNLTWKNHISNVSLKSDFTFYKSIDHTLNFGFKWSGHNFNPGNAEDSLGNIPDNIAFVPKRNATEFSIYYDEERKINDKLLITIGLRISTWTNYGKTIEYQYDKDHQMVDSTIYDTRGAYNTFANLEPRLSATYLVSVKSFLKFNYSRSAQYINLISNSISPFNNLEVWMPASLNIAPQIANQFTVGWYRRGEKYNWQVESYYKALQNQIDYSNQAQLLLNPYLEGEVRAGRGKAYGIEGMVTKTQGKLTGWLSYTLSKSVRNIEGINGNNQYSALWDIPHQLSIYANYKARKRINLSGTFRLSSGAPITTPTSFYQYAGRVVPIYDKKNNDRLPVYHRFDFSASFQLNKSHRKFKHALTLSIFNFYGQKNVILKNYNKVLTSDGKFIVPTNISGNIEVIPSKVYIYDVVPSITYSFKI